MFESAMSSLANVLVKAISKLFQEGVGYDLQIVVGEAPNTKTFEAHSLILHARSPYFNNILTTTQDTKSVDGKMNIRKANITPYVFRIILG